MNTFIYKPKYEKQPKINNAIISNQPSKNILNFRFYQRKQICFDCFWKDII